MRRTGLRHLLIYLREYKKECILAPLFKMLEASFELFIPLVVAAMIDKGMAQSDKVYIVKCCILLIVLAFVGLISAVTAQFFSAKAAVGFATGVRKDLFAHLLHLSYSEYDELGSSTMITRMTSDVMQTQTGVNMFLRLTLRSPFVVVGAMVMAFFVDAKAAATFAVVIIMLTVVVAFLMSRNIPLMEKVQGKLDKVLLITRENLTGVRVLRAFGQREHETNSYKQSNNELYDNQIKSAMVSSIMNPATYVIINMGIVVLIYAGALRVNNGNLTQGGVVALYNYMSQILVELIKLANMIVTLNKALASGNRIADVLKIVNSQDRQTNVMSTDAGLDDTKKQSPITICEDVAVSFENVSFRYNEGGDEALSNINFSVRKGEVVGIIGGTGAGKTTLVNLIPNLYDATVGRVCVFGKNVKEYDEADFRKRIGFVFQKAAVFSGSIADNLRYGSENATNEDMLWAMHCAVADDVVEQKGGLDAYVGEAGKELSGGQKQRLCIARALVRRPEILIFDDSTSALDFATQAKFIDNLKTLDYNPTIFIVSQRTLATADADKIIVLEDGAIKGIGKHEQLLRECSVYQDIYNAQFG